MTKYETAAFCPECGEMHGIKLGKPKNAGNKEKKK